MDLETLVIHGYQDIPLFDGAVTPPIQLSTTFEREKDGSYPDGLSYGRRNNPNRDALESSLAKLEGGAEAAMFASGTAATMAVFQSLGSGDHVLVARDSYYGTRVMLQEIFPRWGLQFDLIDMTDVAAVTKALRPNTRMIWVETPSNPTMRVTDLEAVAAVGKKSKITLVCDNTVATPLCQRPFDYGYDLVVHSTTKYLNGHSDVIGGAVIARESKDLFALIRTLQVHGGAIPSPFDCWLTQRGLKTFACRVKAQSASAQLVAEFLQSHAAVTVVHYCGLPSHPQHQLAAKQMRHFSSLLSFEVKGGEKEALAVAGGCTLIRRATSLGGVESLIEQRASMEGAGTTTPPNLLRMSVGLESAKDLIQDLKSALDRLI